jgi:hypothetical protein
VPENSWGAGTDPLDRGNPLLPLLEAEKTRADDPVDANHSYIVVMPRAVQSLHDLITSQRIAGCDGDRVVDLFRGIVACVMELHEVAGVIHFDITPRNVLIREDGSVTLCDLDASMPLGSTRCADAKLGSSGYYAPEVARWAESQPAAAAAVAFSPGALSRTRSSRASSTTVRRWCGRMRPGATRRGTSFAGASRGKPTCGRRRHKFSPTHS